VSRGFDRTAANWFWVSGDTLMLKKTLLAVVLLSVTGFSVVTVARNTPEEKTISSKSSSDFRCEDCHQCASPTQSDPCLWECPRPRDIDTSKIPDVVVLNQLENLYGPAYFNHERHAQMSGTGNGCAICHFHYPPGHVYGKCSDCHATDLTTENIEQPTLKAIYHRKCLACHQEWSHAEGCENCHVKKGTKGAEEERPPEHPYKVATPPDKRVWESNWGGGTIITFFHKNHFNLYGVTCSQCHQQESCDNCHDVEKPREKALRTAEGLHAMCNQCHAKQSCQNCHRKEEVAEFTHDRTGWPLNRFHKSLSCDKCHKVQGKFAGLSRNCNGCHADWSFATFDHARIAGVELGAIHREADCGDCHENRDFSQKPTCTACHDDGRSYPKSKPGS
jgi:hypothetical protein